jgi:hypothetical protein
MLCTATALRAANTAADAVAAKLPLMLRWRAAATANVALSRCCHRR